MQRRLAVRAMLWLLGLLLYAPAMLAIAVALLGAQGAQAAGTIPSGAWQHRLGLRQAAMMVWGLDAPVATFAAQIHQESRWAIDARSPVGAHGLAQFMPSTARWISGLPGTGLAGSGPGNPTWALRALVTYDRWLWVRIGNAVDDCQRMAYVLSAYNGGLGWVYKRQRLSPQPGVCLGATCNINPGIALGSQAENAHYPRAILQQHQPLYWRWGQGIACHG